MPAGLMREIIHVVFLDESAPNLTSTCRLWYNDRWSAGSHANAPATGIILRLFISLVAILQRVLALAAMAP
jgi:hypothetical protein